MSMLLCLATAIFFEARDQAPIGQYAVAEVVLNRVDHSRFPDNACDVVFQTKQFSFTHDGLSDDMYSFTNPVEVKARKLALHIAGEVLESDYERGTDSTHYHTTAISTSWSSHSDFRKVALVGDHIFYVCSGYC